MSESARLAIYPGSFDPPTNGHLDIIGRAARLFDRLVVVTLVRDGKTALFSREERIELLREATATWPNVEIESTPFDGLLVDYARSRKASVVVRGVRGAIDFEGERQLALMNRHLYSGLETVWLVPSPAVAYISSSLVKEIAGRGGPLTGLVPAVVETRLARRHASPTHPV